MAASLAMVFAPWRFNEFGASIMDGAMEWHNYGWEDTYCCFRPLACEDCHNDGPPAPLEFPWEVEPDVTTIEQDLRSLFHDLFQPQQTQRIQLGGSDAERSSGMGCSDDDEPALTRKCPTEIQLGGSSAESSSGMGCSDDEPAPTRQCPTEIQLGGSDAESSSGMGSSADDEPAPKRQCTDIDRHDSIWISNVGSCNDILLHMSC